MLIRCPGSCGSNEEELRRELLEVRQGAPLDAQTRGVCLSRTIDAAQQFLDHRSMVIG